MKIDDLFVETKQVIEEYKEKAELLDQQEKELKKELAALQDEHFRVHSEQEKASLSEKIYLKLQAKNINEKASIINSMLEELAEQQTALKLEYAMLYKGSLGKDNAVKAKYNINEIVDKYRWKMISEVAEIGNQFMGQYFAVEEDLMDIFQDPKVKEQYPSLQRYYGRESFKPSYFESQNVIISKGQINEATGGYVPTSVPKPKGVK